MSEKDILIDISKKLDRLIALQLIGLQKEIKEFKNEIKEDIVSQKILEIADGDISSGELRAKVSEITKVSEKTVERRISDLLNKGLLLQNREGKNIFYINSGIIEV